jgi:hypothetical protein
LGWSSRFGDDRPAAHCAAYSQRSFGRTVATCLSCPRVVRSCLSTLSALLGVVVMYIIDPEIDPGDTRNLQACAKPSTLASRTLFCLLTYPLCHANPFAFIRSVARLTTSDARAHCAHDRSGLLSHPDLLCHTSHALACQDSSSHAIAYLLS